MSITRNVADLIDTSGNIHVTGSVGIGTTNPSAHLHIRNSQTITANTNTLLVDNYATGQPAVIGMRAVADNGGAGNTGAIYFDAGADGSAPDNIIGFNADHQTDTNYDVVIKGNGNVGIGTVNPEGKLHVVQSGNPVVTFERDNGTPHIYFRGTGGTSGHTGRFYMDNGAFQLSQGDATGNQSGNIWLHGLSNGNVGIGTNSPSHQLTVNGETKTNGYNIHLGDSTSIIGDNGTSGWASKPGVLMANGGEFRFHGNPGNIDVWVDGFFVLGQAVSTSALTSTYSSTQAGAIAYSSDDGGQLYYKSSRGWESFTAQIGTSSNPATSGLQLYNAGYPSGYYYISVSGYSDYYMYVDNSRNGGGWVMAVRATVADNQAHSNNNAVNFDGTNGPTLGQTSTRKVSDAWMNAYRSQSPYTGSTAYWLETTGGFTSSAGTTRNMFVDSNATVDTVSSASNQNERTRVTTTFEGSISDRDPNTGTRGFGDHHTSGGTYFAYQRHPEQGNNSGFRNDALGGSDGYLWIK